MPVSKWYLRSEVGSGGAGAWEFTTGSTVENQNRQLLSTPGSSQTFLNYTTLAQTTGQAVGVARFFSPALAAQSVPASFSWTSRCARAESNTNVNLDGGYRIGFWRPSAGATVISDGSVSNITMLHHITEPASAGTEEDQGVMTYTSNSFEGWTLQDGDYMLLEVYFSFTQSMATAYAATFYWAGTTEGSATSNAAYIGSPSLTLLSEAGSPAQRPKQNVIDQAVSRSLTRCQKLTRRKSGIFVPAEWKEKLVVCPV